MQAAVASWLRAVAKPRELFEQAVSGGAVRYTGPARVSARALGRVCAGELEYTLLPRAGATEATVEVGVPTVWAEPPPLTSGLPRAVTEYLRGAMPDGVRIDLVPKKLCGATQVITARGTARVAAPVVDKLLAAPGVLDVVLSPAALTVTLAAGSDKLGSLSHLAHRGSIAPRLTRITPHAAAAKAGRALRRPRFGRRFLAHRFK